MACGGCRKNNKPEDKPMFSNGGPNPPMRMLMERNGIKIEDNSEQKKVIEKKKQRIIMNLGRAALAQKFPIKWFKDGLSGLIKCLEGDTLYDDDGIKYNRDQCRNCPHATKDESGNLTVKSQCMAPDPEQNNAPCGCLLLCKTQTGKCPLNKFTEITIKGV